mgnify:CR=1 FL=1
MLFKIEKCIYKMTDIVNNCSENINEEISTVEETNKDTLDDNSTANHDDKDPNSDSDYGLDSESESDTEVGTSSRYSYNKKSKKYVITVSNTPVFYTDDLETARNIMWEVAREIKREFFNNNLFIYEGKNEDQITISVKHKYFLITYEQIIHTLNIFTIYESTILKEESEVEEITDKEENKEEENKEEEESKDSQEGKFSSWQHLLFTS